MFQNNFLKDTIKVSQTIFVWVNKEIYQKQSMYLPGHNFCVFYWDLKYMMNECKIYNQSTLDAKASVVLFGEKLENELYH